ncbi:MAG: inositol monophosphatase [Chlorobi bacterium]|nr:inositol monophosphatase [Chlorobiota bacterium]
MINCENICRQVSEVAKETGKFILNEKNKINPEIIETKGLNSFVTYVDKNAEKLITEKLKKILPEAGFITEEGTETKQAEKYNWIVDPLDGTTNFIHGLEPFAVSIALSENNKIICGTVYEAGKDECFYAWRNSKAYLNGKEIKVTETNKLADSLVATGFPYYDFSENKPVLESLDFLMKNSHGIRRLGSAATDLVYVACGRIEAFYEYGLSPWDVAAGAFIVQQAGGKVSDFEGGDNYIFGREIIAANNNIFEEFSGIIKNFFKNK